MPFTKNAHIFNGLRAFVDSRLIIERHQNMALQEPIQEKLSTPLSTS
jgi:hypothetical protein